MKVLDRFRLDDKVAVVTGGNRGLGRAISQARGSCAVPLHHISKRAGRGV